MDIRECLKKRFLIEIKSSEDLIKKEIEEAEYDFEKAKKAFDEEDYKWSIIKGYYSMFHAARAVLFKLGFAEKRHFAINIVLEDLNKKGKLELKYVNNFKVAVSSREDADYHYVYSIEIAEHNLEIAREFIDRMKLLIK